MALGLCFNAIDIAFMASAGNQLASVAQVGNAEVATLFDSLHRVGLMTARFGNALVALGAIMLSWVERQENHALAVAIGGARGVRGTVLRDLRFRRRAC